MSKKVYVKPYRKEFREQVVKLVQLGDRSALEVAGNSRFRWIRYGAVPPPPGPAAPPLRRPGLPLVALQPPRPLPPS